MFNIWPKMATKRKFNMVDLSDEEGSSEKINGVSLFNKYKNKTPTKTNPDKVAPNVVKEKTLNETSRVPTEEPGPSHENVDSQKVNKKQIGKTFAQTFAFLKDTDLYELPPKPTIPEKVIPKNSNAIIVNSKQRGNPILKYVRNIPWEYGNIVPDYEVGQTSCILFLSLRYHNLNPDYIHERLKQLGSKYTLRVLLVQVDVQNTKHSLKELGKIAILADCTLILAWSPEEAGRYLETYKAYEHKPPDVLQERVEADYIAKMQDVLTTIKSINRTDVITLLSTFGSLKKIVNANKDEIGLCPGFGPQKAQRLYKVLNESFKRVRVTDQLVDKGITANPSASPASKLKRPTPKTDISETKLIKPITETKSKSIKTTEKQVNESDLKMGDRNTNNDSSISEISGKSLLSHNMSKAEAIRQFGLSRKIKSKEIEDQPSSMDELSEVQPVVVLSESSSLAKPGDTQSKSFSKQLSEVRSNTDDEKSSSKRHVNTKLKEDAEKSSNPIPMSCVSNKTSLTDAEYSDLIASSDEDELSDDD